MLVVDFHHACDYCNRKIPSRDLNDSGEYYNPIFITGLITTDSKSYGNDKYAFCNLECFRKFAFGSEKEEEG